MSWSAKIEVGFIKLIINLNRSWSDEKNTVKIEAGVMKEYLLSRSWINENVLIVAGLMKRVLPK